MALVSGTPIRVFANGAWRSGFTLVGPSDTHPLHGYEVLENVINGAFNGYTTFARFENTAVDTDTPSPRQSRAFARARAPPARRRVATPAR